MRRKRRASEVDELGKRASNLERGSRERERKWGREGNERVRVSRVRMPAMGETGGQGEGCKLLTSTAMCETPSMW